MSGGMARRRRPHRDEETQDEQDSEGSEGFVRGTVKRLFESGVAAPVAARTYILEQIAGWKSDFLGIFQSEIRRFLDRQSASEELEKLLEGKKIELKVSVRLVDDEDPPPRKKRR
jgi:hypothetical protein